MSSKSMRRIRAVGGFLTAAGVASFARTAPAQQVDVNPPMPDVLLLLDTSGSMERMTDGTEPDANAGSKCNVTNAVTGAVSSPNRWGIAIEALTGHIANASTGAGEFRCASMSRAAGATPSFTTEYGISGKNPYDTDYYLNYHRPASGSCVYAPGTLPGVKSGPADSFIFSGAGASIITRNYQLALTTTGNCTFSQLTDGAIDSARDTVRFGLMTFDSTTSSALGVGGLSTNLQVIGAPGDPFAGTWSYFPGWDSGGTCATGSPHDCLPVTPFEVGARNPAAPPWEGRMVRVPIQSATLAQVQLNNDTVQQVINATRPFGATPIAGMVEDALQYFWTDTAGPKDDIYVKGGCRDQYIILVTDGAPNLDLRPSCSMTATDPTKPGKCPYALAQNTVGDLYTGSHVRPDLTSSLGKKVSTFVIGFAVSDSAGAPVACTDVVTGTSFDPTGAFCGASATAANLAKYAPCCALEQVALKGSNGTQGAFFAGSASDLNSALSTILAKIGRATTTRTVPAYSPVTADVSNLGTSPTSSLYYSAFVPQPGLPWSGDVQRQRYVCKTDFTLDTTIVPTATAGDDFATNLNTHSGTKYTSRQFSVILPGAVGDAVVNSTGTIRPFAPATPRDGYASYGAVITAPTTAASAIAALSPAALGITNPSAQGLCPNTLNNDNLSAAQCKELALNFAMAQKTTTLKNSTFVFNDRYYTTTTPTKSAFGDIFHSTPTVVGPPGALIRDESYQGFKSQTSPQVVDRPTVLYTATNDGLLHAFDTSIASAELNEIWALIPPAVLPNIINTYPAAHALLLDGAPIIKDVVWARTASDLGDKSKWHTMLVASFGSASRGYYAVDVTSPGLAGVTGQTAATGPVFRWQLTNAGATAANLSTGQQIFGVHSATPAITTVYVDLGSSAGGLQEIGVAVLPGGADLPAAPGACARHYTAGSTGATGDDATPFTSTPNYAPRATVPCYGNATGTTLSTTPVAGRSLTIVRLDTGEILRTFSPAEDKPFTPNWTAAPFDSPMTGTPVVYPATVGAIAQKVYIGDSDGTVWRFDLSSTDPTKWKGELFFDTYNQTAYTGASAPKDGQPIAVQPVVALDRAGNLAIEIATGDQETFTPAGTNFVWSLTERFNSAKNKLLSSVNWYIPFGPTDGSVCTSTSECGKKVSGPMAVFDGVFYFATFNPAATAAVCAGGTPEVYGRDFVVPRDTSSLKAGGDLRLIDPTSGPPATTLADPSYSPAAVAGSVIPGLSINVPPTCANTSTSSTDPYTNTSHYSTTSVNPNPPSLVGQVGKAGTSGAAKAVSIQLTQPRTATVVDSWAAVVE